MTDRFNGDSGVFFTKNALPYSERLEVRTPRLTWFGFPPDKSVCATVFYTDDEPTSLPDINVYTDPEGYEHNGENYPVVVYLRLPQSINDANEAWWEGIGHAYRHQVQGDRKPPISTNDSLAYGVQKWGPRVLMAGGALGLTAAGLFLTRTGNSVIDVGSMFGGAGITALGDQMTADPVSVLSRVSPRDRAARRFAETHRTGTGPIFPKSS